MNVVYLPGFLGSTLGYDEFAGGRFHEVWLDLYNLLTADARFLQLGPDGLSPGPLAEGRVCYPKAIVEAAYEPLALAMEYWGWNVMRVPWDWRLSVLTESRRVWPLIRQRFGSQPFTVLGHSFGGLLARAVYGQMQQTGGDGQLTRIVTLCTPHWGSLETCRLLWRMPRTYRGICLALGWPELVDGAAGPAYLDSTIASWPGVYELLASASGGPLYAEYPAQAASLYKSATYAGANPFASQALMTAAVFDQEVIAGYVPKGRLASIAGTGYRTAESLSGTSPPDTDAGWVYTQDGDGLVTLDQAFVPGCNFLTVNTDHGLALLDPRVWAVVRSAVLTGG